MHAVGDGSVGVGRRRSGRADQERRVAVELPAPCSQIRGGPQAPEIERTGAGSGLSVEIEKPIAVYYGPNVVGTFEAALVVERRIIVELRRKKNLFRRTRPSLQIS